MGNKGTITQQNCDATMVDWLLTTANGTDTSHAFVPTTMAFVKCFRHPCKHEADFGKATPLLPVRVEMDHFRTAQQIRTRLWRRL